MTQPTFNERAGVRYATVGRGKRVHYSPGNDDTLCGRMIERYVGLEGAVALFENGHELCTPCHRAAEKRAAARLDALAADVAQQRVEADELLVDIAEVGAELDQLEADTAAWAAEVDALAEERGAAVEQAPAVHHFRSTGEAYSATQCRDDIADGDVLVIEREQVVGFLRRAWPGAITRTHGELHTFTADPRTIDDGRYAVSVKRAEQIARELGAPLADAQHVVEGVIVGHNGVTEGSLPKHSAHPDVRAAVDALDGLRRARLTDYTDTSRYAEEIDDSVRGYMVEPRGNGRVAAYWIEGGLHTLPDGGPHRVELDILRMKFERAGWTVEPKSMNCVFAWRPTVDEPTVEVDEARCLHGQAPRPDVSGNPIIACTRKHAGGRFGVWSDEGCTYTADCAVEAANECARLNDDAEAPTEEPLYGWAPMCGEHDEQTLDECDECNAIPVEDRCPDCSGKGCHRCYGTGERESEQGEVVELDVVAEVEVEVAGTWRSGWIASEQASAGDALFDLGEDVEQGALFE